MANTFFKSSRYFHIFCLIFVLAVCINYFFASARLNDGNTVTNTAAGKTIKEKQNERPDSSDGGEKKKKKKKSKKNKRKKKKTSKGKKGEEAEYEGINKNKKKSEFDFDDYLQDIPQDKNNKFKTMLDHFRNLTRKICDTPSMLPILDGSVTDHDMWLNFVFILFPNRTIVFHDENNKNEAKLINETLVKHGAIYDKNTTLSDIIFVNLGSPEGYKANDHQIISTKNCIIKALRSPSYGYINDNEEYNINNNNNNNYIWQPQIFMKGVWVGENHTILQEAYEKEKKKQIEAEKNKQVEGKKKKKKKTKTEKEEEVINGIDMISTQLVGQTPKSFVKELLKKNNRTDKLVIFGRWGQHASAKTHDAVMLLNATNDKYEFVDLDLPELYDNLYTNKQPLQMKKEKTMAELGRFSAAPTAPFAYLKGTYCGSAKEIETFVNMTIQMQPMAEVPFPPELEKKANRLRTMMKKKELLENEIAEKEIALKKQIKNIPTFYRKKRQMIDEEEENGGGGGGKGEDVHFLKTLKEELHKINSRIKKTIDSFPEGFLCDRFITTMDEMLKAAKQRIKQMLLERGITAPQEAFNL